MPIYRRREKFTIQGIQNIIDMNNEIMTAIPALRNDFIKRSLDYLDERARYHLAASIGNGSYVPTGELMSHFRKEYELGKFLNDCYYAALVEYGTGIVGSGTHPNAKGYQYDVNNHGEDGWYYMDEHGKFHWTKGMQAHRYMFNALNDYLNDGVKKVFSESFKVIMGGIIKK